MTNFRRVGVYVLLPIFSLSIAACDSDDDDDQKSSGTSEADAGEPDAVQTVRWGVSIWEFGEEPVRLEGIEVCLYPALKVCETTNEEGFAVLAVPADSEAAVLVDGSSRGYIKLLGTFKTTDEDDVDQETGNYYSLSTTERAAQAAEAGGYTIDPKKGGVIAQALDAVSEPVEGVTYALDPPEGVGPIYYGSEGPDKSSTSTTVDGSGLGIFASVPPGDYMLAFTGKKCVVGLWGWDGKAENSTRLPVLAGVRTLVAAQCE